MAGLKWDSCFPASIDTVATLIPLEMSAFYNVPDNPELFEVEILGVKFDATIDLGPYN